MQRIGSNSEFHAHEITTPSLYEYIQKLEYNSECRSLQISNQKRRFSVPNKKLGFSIPVVLDEGPTITSEQKITQIFDPEQKIHGDFRYPE